MASTNTAIPLGTANTGKPPIAWRKDVRDHWEATKKPEIEKNIFDVTGVKYELYADTSGIWTYCKEGWSKSNPGGMLFAVFQGVWTSLRYFKDVHGQGGIDAVNTAAYNHVITIEPSADVRYADCDFVDGKLRVLFNPNENFAGADNALAELSKALTKAPSAPGKAELPFETAANIREKYDAAIPDVLARVKTSLKIDSITFVPNFEDNFAAVLAFEQQNSDEAKDSLNRTWKQTFGRDTLDYYKGLLYSIDLHGIGKDEMLNEAFQDGVSSGKIALRVVPKTTAQYCETVIEDGVLYMQCVPKWWAMSNSNVGAELLSAL